MGTVIDVAIGISFIFLLLSVIASATAELVSGLLRTRARFLEKAIVSLVSGTWSNATDLAKTISEIGGEKADTTRAVEIVNDPRLATGYGAKTTKPKGPSYITAATFADLLLHNVIGPVAKDPTVVDNAIAALPGTHLRENLERIWHNGERDIVAFRTGIERWYDERMDRVSGWYKRQTRWILLTIGFVLAIGLNVVPWMAAHKLWTSPTTRDLVVQQAKTLPSPPATTATGQPTDPAQTAAALLANYQRVTDTGLPLGWGKGAAPGWSIGADLVALLGWITTAIGVSLGAPFWFDLLSKVSNLRLAGSNPVSPAPAPPSPPGSSGNATAAALVDGGATTATVGSTTKLPVTLTTAFDPVRDGFHFNNDFENTYQRPFAPMGSTVTTSGRCGGMAFGALDYHLAGKPAPETATLPDDADPLGQYLFGRLISSWSTAVAPRFILWSTKTDDELTPLVATELGLLEAELAKGQPVPLGMISAHTLADSKYNHQVLAHSFARDDAGVVTIGLYDPNTTGVAVVLTVTPGRPGVEASNRPGRPWRALFVNHYSPAPPPAV